MKVINDITIHSLGKKINESLDPDKIKRLTSDLKIYCDSVGADYSEVCKMLKLKSGGIERLNNQLISWLNQNIGEGRWEINEETGKIDILNKYVRLQSSSLEDGALPKDIEFGICAGSISCNNIGLKSLERFPKVINGDFSFYANKLESLEFCPEIIKGSFDCSNNNLKTLVGGPKEVGEAYNCGRCSLTSLEGIPNKIGGYFNCEGNGLTTLEGGPEEVTGEYNCNNNQLKTLKGISQKFTNSRARIYCNSNNLYTLEGLPIDENLYINVDAKRNLFPENILRSTYASARRYGSWVAAYLVLITTNTFQRMSKEQRDPIRDELSQENLKKKQIGLSKIWNDPIMDNPAIQRIVKKANLQPENTAKIQRAAGLSDIGL